MINRILFFTLIPFINIGCGDTTPETIDSSTKNTPGSMQKWQVPYNADFSNYRTREFKLHLAPEIRHQKVIMLKIMASSDPKNILYLSRIISGIEEITLNLSTLNSESSVIYELFTDTGITTSGTILATI